MKKDMIDQILRPDLHQSSMLLQRDWEKEIHLGQCRLIKLRISKGKNGDCSDVLRKHAVNFVCRKDTVLAVLKYKDYYGTISKGYGEIYVC